MEFAIQPPQTPILGYIFDFPIRYYGILMAISFIVGVMVAYFIFYKKHGSAQADIFLDYSPYVILFSILGARFFYVLGSFEYYFNAPSEIIMINHGGLSIYGAIVFGFISMYVCSKKFKFDFMQHCDIIAVSIPLCQAIGRFGNYFNQEAFGMPSQCFLKLFVDKQFRPVEYMENSYFHPTFLYESLFDILIFIILFYLLIKKPKKAGFITSLYLFLYAIVRFFIEFIRIDSVLNIGSLTIAQIISLTILIFALFLYFYTQKKSLP